VGRLTFDRLDRSTGHRSLQFNTNKRTGNGGAETGALIIGVSHIYTYLLAQHPPESESRKESKKP
jgi:hypothetical protein